MSQYQKIKGNAETVIAAVDLYMKGVSYRGIADTLRQLYGLKVHNVTVMHWVNTYMARMNEYVAQLHPSVGDVWHADEQFIKVKGEIEYIWNVLDNETRFLLASNESPNRGVADAKAAFRIAKATAGKRAQTVITDGAFNYVNVVRREFATRKNPKPHYRYVSLKQHDSNNNHIERFHGSFRQRDKVMRGFKTNQAQYAENFRTYYNFVRTHETLGKTPAQAAGLNEKASWKELLLKSQGKR